MSDNEGVKPKSHDGGYTFIWEERSSTNSLQLLQSTFSKLSKKVRRMNAALAVYSDLTRALSNLESKISTKEEELRLHESALDRVVQESMDWNCEWLEELTGSTDLEVWESFERNNLPPSAQRLPADIEVVRLSLSSLNRRRDTVRNLQGCSQHVIENLPVWNSQLIHVRDYINKLIRCMRSRDVTVDPFVPTLAALVTLTDLVPSTENHIVVKYRETLSAIVAEYISEHNEMI